MIFHRLRMLSFSKSLLSIKSLNKTKSDVKEPIRCEGAPDVVELSMPLGVFQAAPNTKVPKENAKKSCPDRIPVKPRLKFKSKSETFKISLRKLRKRTNRRTLSLNDIKRRLSLKDLNLNRIKQKFQSFKKENIGKTNKNVAKKHELKVLYIAETSQRNRKRRRHHRKLNIMQQSSRDLFGFHRHNRLFDSHTFYHRNNKDYNPFNKLRARCAQKRIKFCDALNNCPYTHHPFKLVTSDSNKSILSETTCCNNPLHYNLLKFPKNSKTKLSRNNSVRHQCFRKSWGNRNIGYKAPVRCCDKAVSAGGSEKRSNEHKTPANGISKTCPSKTCPSKTCPSKTCPSKTCPSKTFSSKTCPSKTCPSKTFPSKTCPSKTCPSKIFPSKTCPSKTCPTKTCPSKTCPSLELRDDVRSLKKCKRRRKSKQAMRKFTFGQLYHKMYSKLSKYRTAAHSKYRTQNASTRYVLKLVFLSLIVIAWSPCIIGIAIGWLLSSPLRPQHVVNDENEKTQESVDDCFCRFDWWTKYIDSIGSLSKASKNVFSNLFKRQKDTKCKPECLPRCRSHPDQGTRYSLYHADGRGWVIKPERPSAPVPSKENIFKRAFKNMFRDCECSSQNPSINRIKIKTCGSANMNESISPEKKRVNTSLRATGNPTLNVCGYTNKQSNNKHRQCFVPPKIHNSEDDSNSQFLPCLGCMPQKSQAIATHEIGQSNETVTSSEAVDNETLQQKLEGAKRHSDLDHDQQTECPTQQKPEDVCFQKLTNGSEICNNSQIHRSSILDCLNPERSSGRSFIDKLINSIRCRLDFIALSRQNLEGAPNPCAGKLCKVSFPNDTSKPGVCCKSVCTHLSKDTSTTRGGKSVHLQQETFEPQVRSEPERNMHQQEKTSSIKICRKSTCKFQLPEYKNQVEMKQSLKSFTEPDPEFGQPTPVRGRSVLKSSSRRSSTKPTRITIADPPRRSRGSQKVLYLKIDNTKTTQTQEDGLMKPSTSMSKRKIKDKKSKKQGTHVGPPKKKELPFWNRVWCGLRSLGRRTTKSIDQFDDELHNAIFPVEVGCADQYLNTLRDRPCFWVYDCCPRKYPSFLKAYYGTKTCCYFCMMSFSICFWAPLLLWCYMCYKLCYIIFC